MKSYDARVIRRRHKNRCRWAFVIDVNACQLLAFLLCILACRLSGQTYEGFYPIYPLYIVLLGLALYLVSDLLLFGRSLGKRCMGLAVYRLSDGARASRKHCVQRNLGILLLPAEVVLQLITGCALCDGAAKTVVLQVSERSTNGKGEFPPKWMQVCDGLQIVKLEKAFSFVLALVMIFVVVTSQFAILRSEEYAMAYEYVMGMENVTDKPKPVEYSAVTTVVDGQKTEETSISFWVDGRVIRLLCENTEGQWSVSMKEPT